MLNSVNLITLAVIGYVDYVSYKIPNVIICGWMITTIYILNSTTTYENHLFALLQGLLVAGSYFPLSHIVKCSAGDFKLFGMLVFSNYLEDGLKIIFITLLISLFPFASGVKKVQLGPISFFGYIAFLLLRKDGIL